MKIWRKLFVRKPDLTRLDTGAAGEAWVSYLYELQGFEILARNHAIFGRKKLGELDIISRKGRRIVIVEVKTRRSEDFMPILEAVDFRKQQFLRRMAKLYLQHHPEISDFDLQIDIAAVLLSPFDNSVKSVRIIENAIEDSN